MLQVPTKTLILIASFVWFAGSLAVISTGINAATEPWSFAMAGGALVTWLAFLALFLMIARKHIRRITGYTARLTSALLFFDVPSYLIFVIMIGMGFIIRFSGLVSGDIIAAFYCGLGTALLTASVYYLVTYIALCEELARSKR